MSGLPEVDQPRAMYLVELATELAIGALSAGGSFVTKVFQGEGFEAWHREIRSHFQRVVTRKPSASRPRSREVYIVATGFKPSVAHEEGAPRHSAQQRCIAQGAVRRGGHRGRH